MKQYEKPTIEFHNLTSQERIGACPVDICAGEEAISS